MKSIALALVVASAGCLQPQPRAPASTAASHQNAMCTSKAYELETRCRTTSTQQPELLAEMLRGELQTFGPGCETELAEAERCVAALESSFSIADPDREQRRVSARPRAETTRASRAYRELVDDLLEIRDAMELACRVRNDSPANERHCRRWEERGTATARRLDDFLQRQGFDRRDYKVLQLWPGGIAVAAS